MAQCTSALLNRSVQNLTKRLEIACCLWFLTLIVPVWAKQSVTFDLQLAHSPYKAQNQIILTLGFRNSGDESACIPNTFRGYTLNLIDVKTNQPYRLPSGMFIAQGILPDENPQLRIRTVLPSHLVRRADPQALEYPLDDPWNHPSCSTDSNSSVFTQRPYSSFLKNSGYRLEPGDMWEATINIAHLLETGPIGRGYLAPGKYRAAVSFTTHGEVITSPEREFTLLPRPQPDEESLRVTMIKTVEEGEAYLKDYPEGAFFDRACETTLSLAREAEDWAAVARVAEQYYKGVPGRLSLFRRSCAGHDWAEGLWYSGKKKEAEDLLAHEDVLEGWYTLRTIRREGHWPGQRSRPAPDASNPPASPPPAPVPSPSTLP